MVLTVSECAGKLPATLTVSQVALATSRPSFSYGLLGLLDCGRWLLETALYDLVRLRAALLRRLLLPG